MVCSGCRRDLSPLASFPRAARAEGGGGRGPVGGWGWGTVTAGLLLLDSRVHKCGHNADLTLVSVGQLPMVPAHGAQRALTHVPGSPPPRQLSGIVGRQECHVLLFNPMPQSPSSWKGCTLVQGEVESLGQSVSPVTALVSLAVRAPAGCAVLLAQQSGRGT